MSGARRIIRALTLAALLAASVPPLHAQEKTEQIQPQTGTPKKSSTAAVFLSMGLPGAGQIYTHQYIKAAAAIAAEGALGASISYNNDLMLGWRKSADNALALAAQLYSHRTRADTTVANGLVGTAKLDRSNQKFFQNQRNRLIWWLAGTVLLSMGDAYVDAQLYGLDFSPSLSLSGSSVGLSVACKF